ncbi:hypothetical protein C8Q77DRAFT_564644 [Trametes polyzona]|nr:hypothetical protein C8Q77DRAFT_564644 [Trametes polyzona]
MHRGSRVGPRGAGGSSPARGGGGLLTRTCSAVGQGKPSSSLTTPAYIASALSGVTTPLWAVRQRSGLTQKAFEEGPPAGYAWAAPFICPRCESSVEPLPIGRKPLLRGNAPSQCSPGQWERGRRDLGAEEERPGSARPLFSFAGSAFRPSSSDDPPAATIGRKQRVPVGAWRGKRSVNALTGLPRCAAVHHCPARLWRRCARRARSSCAGSPPSSTPLHAGRASGLARAVSVRVGRHAARWGGRVLVRRMEKTR